MAARGQSRRGPWSLPPPRDPLGIPDGWGRAQGLSLGQALSPLPKPGGSGRERGSVLAPGRGASPFPGPHPQHGPNRRPLAPRPLLRPHRPPPSVCPRAPAMVPGWGWGGWPVTPHTHTHPTPALARPRSPLPVRPEELRPRRTNYSQARGGGGGTVRVPSWQSIPLARGDSAGDGPEVRSGLMSSKASGRSPASQLVPSSPPHGEEPRGAGGGTTPRGQSLNLIGFSRASRGARRGTRRPAVPGQLSWDLPLRASSPGPSAALGGTSAHRLSPPPHPQLHTGQRGEPGGPPKPPGRASARGASIALWSGRPRRGGAEPAPAPRPPCPGSAPGAQP